jgi:hypothetical protein
MVAVRDAQSICSLGQVVLKADITGVHFISYSGARTRTAPTIMLDEPRRVVGNHGYYRNHNRIHSTHFRTLAQTCRIPVFHHAALCIVLAAES